MPDPILVDTDMLMNTDQTVRYQLLYLLNGGNAHMSFDDAAARLSLDQLNAFPPNVPYRLWHVIEHIRICQWDILEFTRNPAHVSPSFPDGLWPDRGEMADQARWDRVLAEFRADLDALKAMIEDESADLYSDLPHAAGYNILREILVVADHNAYHLGELAVLRQVMAAWPAGRIGV